MLTHLYRMIVSQGQINCMFNLVHSNGQVIFRATATHRSTSHYQSQFSVRCSTLYPVLYNIHPWSKALQQIKDNNTKTRFKHILSLNIQGDTISSISEHLKRSEISRWTKELDKLAAPLFNFVRKAIVQQLPSAANLVRWGKWLDSLCPLYKNFSQTNKHVLSNCGSSTALDRYKNVMMRFWGFLRNGSRLLNAKGIVTLELTIFHETNLAKSKDYKSSKYADIQFDTNIAYSDLKIQNYTIEN